MDNLTHSLVGLAAAKAGLERASPLATAVCVLAANAPDADIVTTLGGQSFYLEHHRGITHSVVGALATALLLPLLVWAGERLWSRLRGTPPRANFKGLLVASLVLTASHPLLDWTNNYGVRPLLPWDSRWFYGDLVFILDPWIWLTVGGAAFLLTGRTRRRTAGWAALALALTAAILVLAPRAGMALPLPALVVWFAGLAAFVAMHRLRLAARWGAAIPAAALALVVVYWGGLSLLHERALARARESAARLAAREGEELRRVAAMPVLANPLRWLAVAETSRATLRFEVVLGDAPGGGAGGPAGRTLRVEKPEGGPANLTARAADDARARVFLDFARFPVSVISRGCAGESLVRFMDLRYTTPDNSPRAGTFVLEVPVGEP